MCYMTTILQQNISKWKCTSISWPLAVQSLPAQEINPFLLKRNRSIIVRRCASSLMSARKLTTSTASWRFASNCFTRTTVLGNLHFIVLVVSFFVSYRIISFSSFNKVQKTRDNRKYSFQMTRLKRYCKYGSRRSVVKTTSLSHCPFFVISMNSVIRQAL